MSASSTLTDTVPAIHPTAIVSPKAHLGQGVTIGPYAVIDDNVVIGENTKIGPYVVVHHHTTLGSDCDIAASSILGGDPQDRGYKGEESYLKIGDRLKLGEYCTLHRATGEGQSTIIGDDLFMMAYSHVGHNVEIGKNVTMANNVQLAGHVKVGDFTTLGAMTGCHQNIFIGRMCMIGAYSALRMDAPPFSIVDGIRPAKLQGLNLVGLKRQGVGLEDRKLIKNAFYILFQSGLTQQEALEKVEQDIRGNAFVDELIAFMKNTKRGVTTRTERIEQQTSDEMDV